MSFRTFFKRSSSNGDALDRALNAWVDSDRHSGRSEESRTDDSKQQDSLVTDALEFHRWADETRRTDSAATGPAASTWNRVLRGTAQAESRGGDMSTAALSPERQSAIIQQVRPWNRQQISRYLNNAAMLVIVFGVAFAGAFMAMQVNQPGGSNDNFALMGQNDESGTCDVEPLSVERVMEIVKNPAPYLDNGPAGEPTVPEGENNTMFVELYEPEWTTDVRGTSEKPDEAQFNAVESTVDKYLQCHVFGTVGQSYRFWSPLVIQRQVLAQFPVFADEESVRAWLEVELDQPALSHNEFWERSLSNYDVASISVNPDPALAIQQSGSNYYFAEFITVGVSVENAEGETVLLTTGTGNQLISQNTNTHVLVVTVAQSQESDQWYIVAHYPLGR